MFDNLLLSNKSIPNLQSKKTFFAILASPTLSKDILTCMDLIFPPQYILYIHFHLHNFPHTVNPVLDYFLNN